MENVKTLDRADRIRMFVNEYYFGFPLWIKLTRFIGGPLVILVGIHLYGEPERFGIAYGGFCIVYGIYYTLKPAFWVLFRLDSFKSIDIEIEVTEDKLLIRDRVSQSEILLDALQKLVKRRKYYVFQLAKSNRVYLPLDLLTADQIKTLDAKLRT